VVDAPGLEAADAWFIAVHAPPRYPTAREGAIMAEKSKQKGDAKKPAEKSLKEKRAAKKLKTADRTDHNSKIPPSGR
jgi:hypothetical protein